YRLVVNAGTRHKDLMWFKQHAQAFNVSVNERTDLSIIAVQGPHARAKVNALFNSQEQQQLQELKTFQGIELRGFWLARTGYTGEDGYEIIVSNDAVLSFWQNLLEQNVMPCGLGARDTLRLEAGLNLYGADM